MTCSIPFIELTMVVDKEDFQKQVERAYEKAMKKNHLMYETDFGHMDESLISKGIGITYHDDSKKRKIKFVVFPSLVIDDDDLPELWETTDGNISKLLKKLEKLTDNYFNSDYGLEDFTLSRVDFAVDINVGNNIRVADYIKVLHSIGRVKCFSPIKYKKHDEKSKDTNFGLKGNSNGVEFRAYQPQHGKGTLRVEVRLMKTAAIRAYTEELFTSEQLRSIVSLSEHIFMNTFQHVIPRGVHYKKSKVEKLIYARISDLKMRRRMLRLLTLIPEKKSLHLAQKEMNCRQIKEVMAQFTEIDVSPITISKRHDVKRLENLYSCFG